MTLVCKTLYAAALSLLAAACAGEEPAPTSGAIAVSCADPAQAPLLREGDRPACVAVGAAQGATAEWPDVAGASAVVYVRPGASGVGTREAPLGALAAALAAAPPGGTVALSRGVHTLATTVHIARAVTVRGAGPAETTLDGPPGAPAVAVAAPEGGSVAATLAGVTVRARASGDAAADRAAAGVLASGRGATVTLRDVAVERFGDGVRADGATVCGRGVTVRGALRAGLAFVGGAVASVRSFAVRDGANVGVVVDASAAALRTGLVAGNARDGVVLRGARDGGPCGEGGACAALAACDEPPAEQRCVPSLALPPAADAPAAPAVSLCRGVNLLEDVALVDNRVTGVRAERLPPPAALTGRARDLALAAPGAQATGVRLVVAGTRPAAGLPGGDGVYVGAGARLWLDPAIASEGGPVPGSLVTGNARTGLLVDGDRASPGASDALRTHGTLRAHGTMVRRNEGPGMYVQEAALVERIAYGDFTGNAALGLGVTSGGRVALIQCEHFIGTREGTVVLESLGPVRLGDGLSMAEGTGGAGDTRIEQSRFEGNARFGLILSGFSATLVGVNRARDNAEGVGVFGSTLEGLVGDLEMLTRDDPPAAVARGAQAVPAR